MPFTCIVYTVLVILKTSTMLRFVLVLLVATSAFAAPSVSINQVGINEISPARDYGSSYNGGLSSNVWELSDAADANIYILTLEQVLNDLANQPDDYTKALAVSQTLSVLGELAYGVPGDSCPCAEAINSYAAGKESTSFVNQLRVYIDNIATLAANPNARRNIIGPVGRCYGNGRTFQFEAAWEGILNAASPYTLPLLNEDYCAAKRLYNAFNARSNNVGAAATAAALPPVVKAMMPAMPQIVTFLRAAVNGNAYSAAAAAKAAIRG